MRFFVFVIVLLAAQFTFAGFETCGWEGTGTILGYYGAGEPPIIAEISTERVYAGAQSLYLEDNAPSGTPQAFVAWIVGLSGGDEVAVSIWRFDDTPGAAPSARIWGHWNDDPNDISVYNGSAGGNSDYGTGEGWDLVEYTWTVEEGHTGLVIEVRTYSSAGDIVWVDDLTVSAPEGATIYTPDNYVPIASTTWGEIKAVF